MCHVETGNRTRVAELKKKEVERGTPPTLQGCNFLASFITKIVKLKIESFVGKKQFLIYICFIVAGVVSSREYFDRIKGFIKLLGKANEEI